MPNAAISATGSYVPENTPFLFSGAIPSLLDAGFETRAQV